MGWETNNKTKFKLLNITSYAAPPSSRLIHPTPFHAHTHTLRLLLGLSFRFATQSLFGRVVQVNKSYAKKTNGKETTGQTNGALSAYANRNITL